MWGLAGFATSSDPPDDGPSPLTTAITLPDTTEIRSSAEVFEADEAAQLFISYHKTGDNIPSGYGLRPANGYTPDGQLVDLRDKGANQDAPIPVGDARSEYLRTVFPGVSIARTAPPGAAAAGPLSSGVTT